MLDYFHEINTISYIYLNKLEEPRDTQLCITINVAKAAGYQEDSIVGKVSPIIIDKDNQYEIRFNKFYIAYQVINESFAINDQEDEYIGNILRVYSKSAYLTYNEKNTIAAAYEKEMKHYCIICLNHVIDVISFSEPIISKR